MADQLHFPGIVPGLLYRHFGEVGNVEVMVGGEEHLPGIPGKETTSRSHQGTEFISETHFIIILFILY